MSNRITAAGLLAAGLLAAGCDDPSRPGPDPSLTITPGQLELFAGAVDTLRAVDEHGSPVAGVTWSTSDPDVAAVDDAGVLTAVGAGSASIAATAAGLQDEAALTVHAPLALGVVPIGGVGNRDWFLTFYVDAETGVGIGDYACGAKAYDGHAGTDLVLPSFAAMDAEVAALAAAPGVVVETHDAEYDRNRAWTNTPWNVVWVDHGDGFVAAYGHLMQNSVRVTVGQPVQAGDTLGLIGSSGRSDMPHLHFELLHLGRVIDPFAGPCGEKVAQWADPLPYQDEFHLIDAGVTTAPLADDLVRVKDPPPAAETVTAGDVLYHWVHLHNAPAGAAMSWTLRDPDGAVADSFTRTHPQFFSMSWWWFHASTADYVPGPWTLEFRFGGDVVATRSFTVSDTPAVRAAGPDPVPAPGWGGGGLR